MATPAVQQSPYNIKFLSFQGGGGKGLAYIGALTWLEKYPDNATPARAAPLPLYNGQPAGNSILGVTGASAGAITALMVALGYSSDTIQAKFTPLDLVDQPQAGVCRSVPPNLISSVQLIESGIMSGTSVLSAVTALMRLGPVRQVLEPMFSKLTNDQVHTTTYTLVSNLDYLYCLAVDGGMLTGAKLLSFLQKAIDGSPLLTGKTKMGPTSVPASFSGTTMTFADLWNFNRNSVTLTVMGTNLSTGRPIVFSWSTTPNFPVADAVAISASFPFLFKSIWVSSQQDFGPSANKADLVGWYADGGLTNNVPIHVFDNFVLPKGIPTADPTGPTSGPLSRKFVPTLNPGTLGLRLAEGNSPTSSVSKVPNDPKTTQSFTSFAGQVLAALQFGANDGQLRDPLERKQTVIVYSDGLNLTDFAPQPESLDTAIKNGYNAMAGYYGMPGIQ